MVVRGRGAVGKGRWGYCVTVFVRALGWGLHFSLRVAEQVNHYSIIVRDLAQTEWFYCKLLGFQRLARPGNESELESPWHCILCRLESSNLLVRISSDLPREGLWLWLGNIQLHIIVGPHEDAVHRADGLVCHLALESFDMRKVSRLFSHTTPTHRMKKNFNPQRTCTLLPHPALQ